MTEYVADTGGQRDTPLSRIGAGGSPYAEAAVIDEVCADVLGANFAALRQLGWQDRRAVVAVARLTGISVPNEEADIPPPRVLASNLRDRASAVDLRLAAAVLGGEDIPSKRKLRKFASPMGELALGETMRVPALLPVPKKVPRPTGLWGRDWPVQVAARAHVNNKFWIDYSSEDPSPLLPFLHASWLAGLAEQYHAPDEALINAANTFLSYCRFIRLFQGSKANVPGVAIMWLRASLPLRTVADDDAPLFDANWYSAVEAEASTIRFAARKFDDMVHALPRRSSSKVGVSRPQAPSIPVGKHTESLALVAANKIQSPPTYDEVYEKWIEKLKTFERGKSSEIAESFVKVMSVALDRATTADDPDRERFIAVYKASVLSRGPDVVQYILGQKEQIAAGRAPAAVVKVAAHMVRSRNLWSLYLSEQDMQALREALESGSKSGAFDNGTPA